MTSTIYHRTPLLKQNLQGNVHEGPQIFLKYEILQPSNSFKIRGISNLILNCVDEIKSKTKKNVNLNKQIHVFSSSGGNAGLAATVTCKELNLPCTVVVSKLTNQRMINKIKKAGANVIAYGNHWAEANDYMKNVLMESLDKNTTEAIYVHPFDDPRIWEGHSTMIDEIVETLSSEQLQNVKGIVCSVGGGGLFNGIIRGLERHNLVKRIPVIAVETKGCDSLNKCFLEGKYTKLDKITSVASSLGATAVSEKTFESATKYNSKSIVLNDKEVVDTCLKYADDFDIISEPACGASIHLGYNIDIVQRALNTKLTSKDIIIIIVCGGSVNTMKDLEEMAKK
ncbi:hypothetical protein MOUN0_D06128 [Monosporozyma unispora]|nr:hypothetical protein C6P44_003098 [Kazachstania unispora]